MKSTIGRLASWLSAPTDNAPLILFRIAFGFLLFSETAGAVALGWVHEVFIEPTFTFPMIAFEWLRPLPGNGMVIYYLLMSVTGLMVMVGFHYRASILTFTVLWTITYLMQTTRYNNHYYLLALLSIMMITVPAHRYWSWDVRVKRVKASLTCPRWCILIFILQMAIVYVFASVAKMHGDWLVGRPIEIWFSREADRPIIGWIYLQEWFKWFAVYGGLLFDLFVVPLLLWQRTRLAAFLAMLFFHLFNSITFGIGIFPYLAISLSAFFFPAATINRLFFKKKPAVDLSSPDAVKPPRAHGFVLGFYALFFLVQILLPLRHFLYEGNVNWTEEGHRMAWHMMLRTKSGTVYYRVVDPATKQQWIVHPRDHLVHGQVSRIATRPDMLWQFAQILKREYEAKGIEAVEVYAHAGVSLNGRTYRPFIDPFVNLAEVKWQRFGHKEWILPLGDDEEGATTGR